MGPLIRLCLRYGVHLWFIPPSEPWRNGLVEKFNDHYQQKFLDKITMVSIPQLRLESLAFEHRHNSTYRYSKIKGKTPRARVPLARRRAPAVAASVPDIVEPGALRARWDEVRAGWRELVAAFPAELEGRLVFRHPFVGLMSLAHTLGFLQAHLDHHERQGERVLDGHTAGSASA